MATLTEQLIRYPQPYLRDVDLAEMISGSADSRYGKVKRLLAERKLIHIRRGLYSIADLSIQKPHPFELAQFIYGPSYISLESALSYHQLIPEAVYSVTSATIKRSREFNTPLGIFNFLHLPTENFLTEVELIKEGQYQFFMAKPWKAICDYIFCYKKNWRSQKPLIQSLRIDIEVLPPLSIEQFEILNKYYQHSRITRFLKGIMNER